MSLNFFCCNPVLKRPSVRDQFGCQLEQNYKGTVSSFVFYQRWKRIDEDQGKNLLNSFQFIHILHAVQLPIHVCMEKLGLNTRVLMI